MRWVEISWSSSLSPVEGEGVYVLRRASPSPFVGEGISLLSATLGTDSITFKPLTLLSHRVIVFALNGFADRSAERLFNGQVVRRIPADLQRRARMRLQRVITAVALGDLRIPPSHRLETLRGDRRGQYSIRINDQWRVCFTWTELGASEIEVTDYH